MKTKIMNSMQEKKVAKAMKKLTKREVEAREQRIRKEAKRTIKGCLKHALLRLSEIPLSTTSVEIDINVALDALSCF